MTDINYTIEYVDTIPIIVNEGTQNFIVEQSQLINTEYKDTLIVYAGNVATNITLLESGLNSHIVNYSNPHQVTKNQIGLSNVSDISPLEMPISNLTQSALDSKISGFTNINGFTGNISNFNLSINLQEVNSTQSGKLSFSDWNLFNNHLSNYTNPHNITKNQIGLSNVTDVSPLDLPINNATQIALNNKQVTLISGTNIKTINSTSLLGSGDITINLSNSGINGFTNGNGFTGTVTDQNLSLVLQNANSTQSGKLTSSDWQLFNGTVGNVTLAQSNITTLQGNISNLVPKTTTINGVNLSANISLTTANVSTSTNKNYITDAGLVVLNATSGTNTGDQDLSNYVQNTRTINNINLSSNITLTTANISDSSNKRYVTDAGLSVLNNTSGTNTGDQNLSGYVPTARTINGQNLTTNITTSHVSNSGLGWTSAGHTGGNTVLAGFNSTGAASEYSLSGNGTTILTNNSAALGTPSSGNLTNCNGIAAGLTSGNVSNINVSGSVTGVLPVVNGGTGDTGTGGLGWLALGACTYETADSPTFQFSITSDVTGIIGVGFRIKLTQTTVKYFLVTAVGTFTAGKTIITVYGGTDYTLVNAAITNPYYSNVKIPFGFPINTDKWSVVATDTTTRAQASPAASTVYNLGSFSISIPIGQWKASLKVVTSATNATSASIGVHVGISTANNTLNSDLTGFVQGVGTQVSGTIAIETILTVASKTTHYVNAMPFASGQSNIYFLNSIYGTAIIRAVSAYI